jgi:hypothetical protein
MNWFARNMLVLLAGATTSAVVAGYLIFLEARGGDELFGYMWKWHIPAGALLAGLVGASGYLVGALVLRLRMAGFDLVAILGVSALVVLMVQSAEFALFMGGQPKDAAVTKNMKSMAQFMGTSLLHPPMKYWTTGDVGNGYTAASVMLNPGGVAEGSVPRVSSDTDSHVAEIGGGLSAMMATQDVSQTTAGRGLTNLDNSVESLGGGLQTHGAEWLQAVLEATGFSLGGIVAFLIVRSQHHCKNCMLLLTSKGAQTRYYGRSSDMRNSVDDVLLKAREKHLKESIHAHMGRGLTKYVDWAEYSSTIEIRRCTQCREHQMRLRTRRKKGGSWKDIDLLGFSTTTLEPLDFA